MATVTDLYSRARRRFALDDTVEDPVFTTDLVLDGVNELLAEAAQDGRTFRETFTANLPATTQTIALSTRLNRIVDGTLRIDYDGDGEYEVWPILIEEQTLRDRVGPLEQTTATIPAFYYVRRSDGATELLLLGLWPASDTARTNGIKFQGEVSSAQLTAVTDELPVQETEERYLLPGMMKVWAEVEVNRGRSDAARLLQFWDAKWRAALVAWQDAVESSEYGTRRTVRYVADGDEDGVGWLSGYW